MHVVVVEGKGCVGNMHFVVVGLGKDVGGIANLGDNWAHYYQVAVVYHLRSINLRKKMVDLDSFSI